MTLVEAYLKARANYIAAGAQYTADGEGISGFVDEAEREMNARFSVLVNTLHAAIGSGSDSHQEQAEHTRRSEAIKARPQLKDLMTDPVTVEEARQRTLADYAKHDPTCGIFDCLTCEHESEEACEEFTPKPCTCGLDALLAALQSPPLAPERIDQKESPSDILCEIANWLESVEWDHTTTEDTASNYTEDLRHIALVIDLKSQAPERIDVEQARSVLEDAIEAVTHQITMPGELEHIQSSIDALIAAVTSQTPPKGEEEDKHDGAGLIGQAIPDMEGTEPRPSKYQAPLDVAIENDALVIRIGIQTLAHAVTYSDWANPYDEPSGDYIREFAITDAAQFAKDVASAMESEREDGSTPLSDFIDKMSEEAVNQGSLGLHEDDQRIKHGEKSPLETW